MVDLYIVVKEYIKNYMRKKRTATFKTCGQNVVFDRSCIFGDSDRIEIDSNVYIGPGAYIWARGGLKINHNVIIGPRVTIHTTNHNYLSTKLLPYDEISIIKPVVIEKNVWIGSNVLICPGVTIREGAVVAMGSVVTKDVPKCAVIGGNPAKVIKYRDKEIYEQLDKENAYYLVKKKEGVINSYVKM